MIDLLNTKTIIISRSVLKTIATKLFGDDRASVMGNEGLDILKWLQIRIDQNDIIFPGGNPMSGATSTANGTSGIVPAPVAGQEGYFLKGDGSWSALPLVSGSGTASKKVMIKSSTTDTDAGEMTLFYTGTEPVFRNITNTANSSTVAYTVPTSGSDLKHIPIVFGADTKLTGMIFRPINTGTGTASLTTGIADQVQFRFKYTAPAINRLSFPYGLQRFLVDTAISIFSSTNAGNSATPNPAVFITPTAPNDLVIQITATNSASTSNYYVMGFANYYI